MEIFVKNEDEVSRRQDKTRPLNIEEEESKPKKSTRRWC